MSTKNLARTVIEGGRAWHNCWERRHSNGLERSREAQTSARLRTAIELEELVYRPRPKVYACFRDKLGPAERWLAAQAGRPWSKVRSELVQRFDARTTAGRHILYDHLLPSVEVYRRPFVSAKFTVDRAGILKKNSPAKRRRLQVERPYELSEQVRAWLAGRRVGQRGQAFFWFVQTDSGAFRQTQRLTPTEVTRFLTLPKSYRNQSDAFQTPARSEQ
jgi:hypothetical protein